MELAKEIKACDYIEISAKEKKNFSNIVNASWDCIKYKYKSPKPPIGVIN